MINTEQFIQLLNAPLANALASLNMNYWFVAESFDPDDNKHVYLEFEGDGPRITIQIENKHSYRCNLCGSEFNEPCWDDDLDLCPNCCSVDIAELEE